MSRRYVALDHEVRALEKELGSVRAAGCQPPIHPAEEADGSTATYAGVAPGSTGRAGRAVWPHGRWKAMS